jgi:hypothetical protein
MLPHQSPHRHPLHRRVDLAGAECVKVIVSRVGNARPMRESRGLRDRTRFIEWRHGINFAGDDGKWARKSRRGLAGGSFAYAECGKCGQSRSDERSSRHRAEFESRAQGRAESLIRSKCEDTACAGSEFWKRGGVDRDCCTE